MLSSLTNRVEELSAENERLHELVQVYQEQANESPHQRLVEEVDGKDSSDKEEDTGIQDLSMADLSRREAGAPPADADLQELVDENHKLHDELEKVKKEADNLLQQIDDENIFNLPPGLKEKIRDLEEKLAKEQDEKLLLKNESENVDNIFKGDFKLPKFVISEY